MVPSMHFSECYRHGNWKLINVGTVLMDLSKVCDCLPHDLMIAKLEAKGFYSTSLKSFHSFLSNRNQRVKIGSAISESLDILTGIPQVLLSTFLFLSYSILLLTMSLCFSENLTFAILQMIIFCANLVQTCH